ncbi:chemotaxis protein CheD [Sphingomonas sp. DBB INV C78]|uniref:chemotaxis protein CheD n=1 Tax=Sphingomonas sp. DBB INV C78 TaxID=3349434 RepID=UPI0036D2E1D2
MKAPTREQRINVMQGTTFVTDDPSIVLTTVLGSCIACCLYDPQARLGGMNHFLLSEPRHGRRHDHGEAERYGVYAMELLINEMLKKGASRSWLRAHLYGGANLHAGMREIGTDNGRFAKEFLVKDGIALSQANIGGTTPRRVDFRAAQGQVRCKAVGTDVPIEETRAPPRPIHGGDVELF